MKVFYIDVYFLINFTTDMLALYFSARISHITSTALRLIIASSIGALAACVAALSVLPTLVYGLLVILSGAVVCFVLTLNVKPMRFLKAYAAFIIMQTLLGGSVTLLFRILDSFLPEVLTEAAGPENKNALIFALAILLSYGMLRLAFLALRGSLSEKSVDVVIKIGNREQRISALIDSGNLLCDPMTGNAVIIVKRSALKIISSSIDILTADDDFLRSRVRIIPSKGLCGSGMLTGIRTDQVKILTGEPITRNATVIALDDSTGTFGGHDGLIPLDLL